MNPFLLKSARSLSHMCQYLVVFNFSIRCMFAGGQMGIQRWRQERMYGKTRRSLESEKRSPTLLKMFRNKTQHKKGKKSRGGCQRKSATTCNTLWRLHNRRTQWSLKIHL